MRKTLLHFLTLWSEYSVPLAQWPAILAWISFLSGIQNSVFSLLFIFFCFWNNLWSISNKDGSLSQVSDKLRMKKEKKIVMLGKVKKANVRNFSCFGPSRIKIALVWSFQILYPKASNISVNSTDTDPRTNCHLFIVDELQLTYSIWWSHGADCRLSMSVSTVWIRHHVTHVFCVLGKTIGDFWLRR